MRLEIDDGSWEKSRVNQSIEDILEQNELCSIATVDRDRAHIATCFFSHEEDQIFILTEPDTEHCQHLRKNSSIAVSVYDSRQNWDQKKQGLQLFGKARQAEGEERERAFHSYSSRFPDLEEFAETVDQVANLDSHFYVIDIDRVKVFDEKRFGRETWIEAEVR